MQVGRQENKLDAQRELKQVVDYQTIKRLEIYLKSLQHQKMEVIIVEILAVVTIANN
ncbi:hypothetical protein XIS1_1530004 [Xenorhabdus innexi]|uniref:Uncharacterized protein n=1 Tax=Xenorhabdus innexi TaxID=290109 RepID=A0A1N6MUP3_9GAMM|nr:hypothetical protein XIS1_1530004 [Xenorhabdus innexi]